MQILLMVGGFDVVGGAELTLVNVNIDIQEGDMGFGSMCVCGFQGASTSQVIGARNEMIMDDYDGQMIFGDLMGLKLPDIRLTDEEKPRKNLTQETYPDRESNLGLLHGKRACYHLLHSGGLGLGGVPDEVDRIVTVEPFKEDDEGVWTTWPEKEYVVINLSQRLGL